MLLGTLSSGLTVYIELQYTLHFVQYVEQS